MEYQGKGLGCPPLTTAHHEEVHLSRLGLWKEALKVPNGLWRGPRGGNRGQPWALSDLQLMSVATQAAPSHNWEEMNEFCTTGKSSRAVSSVHGILQARILEPEKLLSHVPWTCDPMDCSLPGSSIHGIFQARVREWVAIPFSKGFSRPRDRTQVSCIAGRLFTI